MGCAGSKPKKATPKEEATQNGTKPESKTETPSPVQKEETKKAPVVESNKEDSGDPEPEKVESDDSESSLSILEGIHDVYELGKELGRGGFSVVVEAKSKKTGEKFAIKCIKRAIEGEEGEGDDIEQLKREIHIMKKVDHANILKLYEVYEEEDDFYLVMELVDGKELFERIVERGQYSEKDANNIIKQIVSAVDYLHDHGIAHRDLKPENLLSAVDIGIETIKIADFGFSKKFGEEKLVTSVGTPGYVAPEVLTAEVYDKSVDMWSVGVIMYILLCGYPPFYGETPPELFKKIIDCQYDFDDPAWEEVSDAAKNLIKNLLVKDPKKRYTAKHCLKDPWVLGQAVGDGKLAISSKLKDNEKLWKASPSGGEHHQ